MQEHYVDKPIPTAVVYPVQRQTNNSSYAYYLHVQADGRIEVHEGKLHLEWNMDQQPSSSYLEMMLESKSNTDYYRGNISAEAELGIEVGLVPKREEELGSMSVDKAIDQSLADVKTSISQRQHPPTNHAHGIEDTQFLHSVSQEELS